MIANHSPGRTPAPCKRHPFVPGSARSVLPVHRTMTALLEGCRFEQPERADIPALIEGAEIWHPDISVGVGSGSVRPSAAFRVGCGSPITSMRQASETACSTHATKGRSCLGHSSLRCCASPAVRQ